MLRGKNPKHAKPARPKIVLFGPPGVGKTWGSLDFPSCYYVDTEGGASLDHYTDKLEKVGALYLGPEDGANDFDVVLDDLRTLATTKHDRKTLIVDSFTKLFNTEIQVEHDRLVKQGKKTDFGVDKKPAVSKTRQLIAWLDKLDMNAILICHEKPLWQNGEQVGATFDGWDKLAYELNLVCQIVRHGADRKAKVHKSRFDSFGEGELLDWSYGEFAKRFGKEVMEATSHAVALATTEQVKQARKLVDMLRIDESKVLKGFESAGVTCWEDMTSDRIQQSISKLQGQLEEVAE